MFGTHRVAEMRRSLTGPLLAGLVAAGSYRRCLTVASLDL